eukprot:7587458-Ditylum_brightwellii.AAC.2
MTTAKVHMKQQRKKVRSTKQKEDIKIKQPDPNEEQMVDINEETQEFYYAVIGTNTTEIAYADLTGSYDCNAILAEVIKN